MRFVEVLVVHLKTNEFIDDSNADVFENSETDFLEFVVVQSQQVLFQLLLVEFLHVGSELLLRTHLLFIQRFD